MDTTKYWLPIAEQLSSGEVLYVTTLPDNKTPLWHLLNYIVYQTGSYTPVFLILVGIGNATIAFLLYRWLSQSGYWKGGVIAGILFISAIPFVSGYYINVRTFAMVFVLAAVLTHDPLRRGALISIAVLFSQFSVFAIPILAIDGVRNADMDAKRWAVYFSMAGSLVGILTYLPLLYWGPEAVIAAIQQSFLNAGHYVTSHADYGNPFAQPQSYAEHLAQKIRQLTYIIVPFILVVFQHVRSRYQWRLDVFGLAAVLSFSFLSTLLLRSITYYWIPPVVFLAAVVGIGVEHWFDSRSFLHRTDVDRQSR